MLVLLLLFSATQAACPTAALHAATIAALDAWTRGDEAALAAALSAVLGDASCPTEWVSAEDARSLHLLHAVASARAEDAPAALWAMRGVLAVDPGYTFPTDLAPPGSALNTAFEVAAASDNQAFVTAGEGAWAVDGVVGAVTVPLERNVIVQLGGPDGALRSWYVSGPELPADLARVLLASTAERQVVADEDCTNGRDDDGDGLADCDDPGCARLCVVPDIVDLAPRPLGVVHVVATADGAIALHPPLFWDGRGARDAGGANLTWPQVEGLAGLSPIGAGAVFEYRTGLAVKARRDHRLDVGISAGVVLGSLLAVGGIYNFYTGDFGEVPSLPIVLGGVGLGLGAVVLGEKARAEPPAPGAVLQAASANVKAAPVAEEPAEAPPTSTR